MRTAALIVKFRDWSHADSIKTEAVRKYKIPNTQLIYTSQMNSRAYGPYKIRQ